MWSLCEVDTRVSWICPFCEEPVKPGAKSTFQRVQGWEKPRSQGGANQITLREPLPEFAHGLCIDERKLGIHPDQGYLFEKEMK